MSFQRKSRAFFSSFSVTHLHPIVGWYMPWKFPSRLIKNSMHPWVFSMKWVVVKSLNFLQVVTIIRNIIQITLIFYLIHETASKNMSIRRKSYFYTSAIFISYVTIRKYFFVLKCIMLDSLFYFFNLCNSILFLKFLFSLIIN